MLILATAVFQRPIGIFENIRIFIKVCQSATQTHDRIVRVSKLNLFLNALFTNDMIAVEESELFGGFFALVAFEKSWTGGDHWWISNFWFELYWFKFTVYYNV
jgi:hypothetical protein